MSDMGVKFTLDKATVGVAAGDPAELQNCMDMHVPERKGTKEAQEAHAFATTSAEDPPCSGGQTHHHHPHQREDK